MLSPERGPLCGRREIQLGNYLQVLGGKIGQRKDLDLHFTSGAKAVVAASQHRATAVTEVADITATSHRKGLG
jgi:hypothetical protein